ncbi:hypothetical protein HDF18_22615 [Mucilaginibacter sp. X5P1]|uniref:hypothetical protein n=1 Tax=Mucilaginibacter sp. X5P1 TaxID=2723088 RepID=UPI0016109039|nr:hypothetical protein [Mucilaginibacter sp. X5P1]MBB6141076.1 hypothetical protein [Mucilaginibacter sp. X5P1]
MSVEKVMSEDWNLIDNKKKRWEDRGFVSCEESYEMEYMLKVFLKHYPHKSESVIKAAIQSCCGEMRGNKPRRRFVECVHSKL